MALDIPADLRVPCQPCIVPLGAGRKNTGGFYASGSAILISRYLALTAKHVVADYHKLAEYTDPPTGNEEVSVGYSIEAGAGFDVESQWQDHTLWCSSADDHDIALLRLVGRQKPPPVFPRLDIAPPRVGEIVTAYGFSESDVTETDKGSIVWKTNPTVSRGRVTAVYHRGREKGMYSFPVFETDVRVENSMSGGPVFNSAGSLCGILAGALPHVEGEPDRSYFSLLWPALGLVFQGKNWESLLVPARSLWWGARFGVVDVLNLDLVERWMDGPQERLSLWKRPPRGTDWTSR
jgi:hypothetical protein